MKRLSMKVATLGMVLLMSTPSVLAADYTQHWAKEAIEKWNGYEVVKGYENGDFRPNNPITRAELAAILDRVFKFPQASSLSPYIDIIASPDKWYAAPVSKVTALELMHIEGLFFEPNAPVTREEAAYAIAKAYELTAIEKMETPFKDEKQISTWALEAVSTLSQYNYIKGTPEGKFNPQSTLTRAEVVTMLDNMTSQLITTSGTYTQSVKGNVVVNSSEIILKNLTIEGNLYISPSVKKVTLENVTVTDTLYINGGSVKLSGKYKEVRLGAGVPITFTSGTIDKLIVIKSGSSLKVEKDATLGELVQNSPIDLEGEGSVAGGQVGQSQAPKLKNVGIYINGNYVDLPVSGNEVVIDIPDLSTKFNSSDRIDGFKITASTDDARITSNSGSIQSGNDYSFKALEEQLGLIREVAIAAGISPTLVIQQLLGSGQVTIGGLLSDYALGKALAAELGYDLQDSYTFERYLTNDQGSGESIYITLRLQ